MLCTMRAKKPFKRQTFTVLITILVLDLQSLPVLAIRPVSGHKDRPTAQAMRGHATNLSERDIPWRQIKFISPQQNVRHSDWHSSIPVISGKGMDHLYLITQYVIDWLQTPGLPEELVKEEVLDDPIPILQENKGRLVTHFWGLILTALVLIAIGIVLPLIGFVCCCCCSSDKHSRRAKHSRSYSSSSNSPARRTGHKKKRYKVDQTCDPCVRTISAVKLFVLLLLMSFFVISAFVTNEYIRSGVQQFPKTLNQSTDDLMLYLNNTQHEVNTLLRTNFEQLEQELGNSLDKSGLIVKNRLAVLSKAAALENLTDIVSKLDSILTDLKGLSDHTTELRLTTVQLQSRLTRSKNDLEHFLNNCRDRVCQDLQRKYRQLFASFRVSTRIDDLPDLSPLMQNISYLLSANIVHEIKRGKQAFDEISYKIQSTVNNTIPDIKRQIKAVGNQLSGVADDVNEALRRPFADLHRVKAEVYVGEQYIEQYEDYRWYAGLGGASIVFIVMVFYSMGLLCGACHQQPTRHNYKRRSKTSSRFFRCGIAIFFLLFFPLLLCTIALFLMGSVSEKVICHYLENPSERQSREVMSILQNRFERMDYAESMNLIQGTKPNLAEVMARCHQNLSLFKVLDLNRFNQIQVKSGQMIHSVNITEILQFKNRYRIEEKLKLFLDRVNVNPSNVVLLTAEGSQLLESLRQTSLGTLNFSSYANVVKDSITPLDLVSISNELESEANRLPKHEIESIARLRNIAMDLKTPINLLVKIKEIIETLTAGAEKIGRKANYGNKGLKEALTSLLKQAEDAQRYIASRGRAEIQEVAKSFVEDMSSLVDQYTEHVIEEIQVQIGKCEPVSRAMNASVMALCKETVLPFNGYWSSVLASLLISIPSTLFAYILSVLYQKVKRFPIRRESDSAIDHLDDNEDDIPLAHVDRKSHSEGRGGPAPSAPPNRTDEDNWSPSSLPPHLFGSRPPPYNFVNN